MLVAALCILPRTHCELLIIDGEDEFIELLNTSMNACATFSIVPDPPPSDCSDLYDNGHNESGVYTVYIHVAGRSIGFDVYCDMTTDGGRWMVFQRRQNGAVDFYRDWESYRKGFGEVDGEHWLGNDVIHLLTGAKQQELRVDMSDFSGVTFYAQYKSFYVSTNDTQFRLTVSGYNGTAGDALKYHNGSSFSTHDLDNDAVPVASCAAIYHGAWWYYGCYRSNLNGPYRPQVPHRFINHIKWHSKRLKQTEMKIRPLKP